MQPSRLIHVAAAAITAALIGLYGINVGVGLPYAGTVEPATHDEGSEHADTDEGRITKE